MKRMAKLCQILLAAYAVFAGVQASGQLVKMREYRLHQRIDRGVRFTTAVMHDKSLLTLVVRENGVWLLTKVQNWWGAHPEEHQIAIRGFSKKDHPEFMNQFELLPTQDGRHVVVLIAAQMKGTPDDPYPVEMILSVVRLDPFAVVASTHSRQLGMKGKVEGILDPSGRIIIRSTLDPSIHGKGSMVHRTLSRLSVPSLSLNGACSYSFPENTNGQNKVELGAESTCDGFATQEGFRSVAQINAIMRGDETYIASGNWIVTNQAGGERLGTTMNSEKIAVFNVSGKVVQEFRPKSMCGGQPVRGPSWLCDCSVVGGMARSAIVSCHTAHDNFFGSSVGLRHWVADVDTQDKRDLSSVTIPLRDSYAAKLVKVGAKKFLVIVLDGSKFWVFSVSDNP